MDGDRSYRALMCSSQGIVAYIYIGLCGGLNLD